MRLLTVTIFYSCLRYTVDSIFVDQRAVLCFLNSETKSLANEEWEAQESKLRKDLWQNPQPVASPVTCFPRPPAPPGTTQTTSWILMESSPESSGVLYPSGVL
jgi:hypothetical protein